MRSVFFRSVLGVALSALTLAARAQDYATGYEDYGAFSNDPVDLDQEYRDTFGRFFQTSFLLGSGLFLGDLALAYDPGPYAGVRFVYYFDRVWAAELGVGFARHQAVYSSASISGVDLQLTSTLIPMNLGFRYAFDPDNLPRGFSMMNPFLSGGVDLVFRSEAVSGVPTTTGIRNSQTDYGEGTVANSSSFGLNFGGGFEFDVYRQKLFLGLDLRYHLMFWHDASAIFGTVKSSSVNVTRGGDYITILGMASYNY